MCVIEQLTGLSTHLQSLPSHECIPRYLRNIRGLREPVWFSSLLSLRQLSALTGLAKLIYPASVATFLLSCPVDTRCEVNILPHVGLTLTLNLPFLTDLGLDDRVVVVILIPGVPLLACTDVTEL